MDGGLNNVAEVSRHLVDCRLLLSIVRTSSECVSHCANENTMNLDLFFLILTISSFLVSTLSIVEMSHHCCSRVYIFKHLIVVPSILFVAVGSPILDLNVKRGSPSNIH